MTFGFLFVKHTLHLFLVDFSLNNYTIFFYVVFFRFLLFSFLVVFGLYALYIFFELLRYLFLFIVDVCQSGQIMFGVIHGLLFRFFCSNDFFSTFVLSSFISYYKIQHCRLKMVWCCQYFALSFFNGPLPFSHFLVYLDSNFLSVSFLVF